MQNEWEIIQNITWGIFTTDYNDKHDPMNGRFAPKYYSDVTKLFLENATPGRGNIDYEPAFDAPTHQDEIAIVKKLHQLYGGDFLLKAEVNEDNVKTADFEWNGELWDLKSPTTAEAARSAVKKGNKQVRRTGGVVLNYADKSIRLDDIIHYALKRFEYPFKGGLDIMIIQGGEVSKILRIGDVKGIKGNKN